MAEEGEEDGADGVDGRRFGAVRDATEGEGRGGAGEGEAGDEGLDVPPDGTAEVAVVGDGAADDETWAETKAGPSVVELDDGAVGDLVDQPKEGGFVVSNARVLDGVRDGLEGAATSSMDRMSSITIDRPDKTECTTLRRKFVHPLNLIIKATLDLFVIFHIGTL